MPTSDDSAAANLRKRGAAGTASPGVLRLLGVAVAALVLAGCAVGPDFVRPQAPKASRYLDTPLTATAATPGVAGGAAQQLDRGAPVDVQWWQRFASPALDALEKQALGNSPTLRAARASLHQAHELALAGRGAYWPSVGVGVSATRASDPLTLGAALSNNDFSYQLFTPQLSIGYAPDAFGAARRNAESLQAQAQAARFAAMAAYNSLTTSVAVVAVEVAALDAQTKATQKLVALDRKLLKTAQFQLKHGAASGLDVDVQRAQLAQLAASLPALRKQQAIARHQLAVLCGQLPGTTTLAVPTLSQLTLPTHLPLSLPSQLVAQRPDVRAAQANWHAASAAVGVAQAARLPQIELSANVGSTALTIADLVTSGTGFWNLAAGLTAPLFEGGALKHAANAAKAGLAAAAAQYRQTVLTAFENVADTLSAIEQDAAALKAATTAAKASRKALDATRWQLKYGAVSGMDLARAQQSWQQARIGLIQTRAQRYADTAALYQALGGGWWHDQHLAQRQ